MMGNTWMLSEKEYREVSALSADKRYAYLIKRISDWEGVWSLRDEDGWALTSDEDGIELVPVWPHPRFADACVIAEWRNMHPARISLDEWLERWLPGMERDGRLVAVFPTPTGAAAVAAPSQVRNDIGQELEKY